MVARAWKPSSLVAEARRTGFLLVLRKLKEMKKNIGLGRCFFLGTLVSPWDPNQKSCVLAGTSTAYCGDMADREGIITQKYVSELEWSMQNKSLTRKTAIRWK